MGQFSWITQDTNEAIRESYGCDDEKLTTAYMHDNKGNVWEETSYEGYGCFGGKDYYQLLAEMNNAKGLNGERYHDRSLGIDLEELDDVLTIYPNLTRNREWKWINKKPKHDPNQGWGDDDPLNE
jgi:hypothetical protein